MKTERLRDNQFELPEPAEVTAYLKTLTKPTAYAVLSRADAEGRLLFQPRCGVGGHDKMLGLLGELETLAQPDILSITIDSYTRLRKFDHAGRVLATDSSQLNGYPLVNHGHLRGRELNAAVAVPLEVRHGSPDARLLFETALASGLTSFEGGGICYNLPYCKDVPLAESLAAWSYVDRVSGELASDGVIVDRELFGTLSAVLMPPAICLALTTLEAILAARDGVKCLSIAYPQGGNAVQDVAALRAVRTLAKKYLPADVQVFPVFHEFMGAFPKSPVAANSLILYGALVARLGRATKIITKTNQEAHGIPTVRANAEGILTAKMAADWVFSFISLDEGAIGEEQYHLVREVDEILAPVLAGANLTTSICEAFEQGRLDIPFSTSRHARSAVIPARDESGAIRFFNAGNLALGKGSAARNRELVSKGFSPTTDVVERVYKDICHFSSAIGS